MRTKNVITVSISIPSDNGVEHTYSAKLPYDGVEHDVMASDLLREVLHLMQGVFGEIDTSNAVKNNPNISLFVNFMINLALNKITDILIATNNML